MSSTPSNFDSMRPPNGDVPAALQNVPEDVLLSWIEGEVSPAEAALYAERYPQAVEFVSSMRRDRAMVAGVCSSPIAAPSDLSDRVLAALEREALLGLADGAPVSDSLPISQVPRRRTARDVWWANATPKLALAAGLTLVVSAVAILVMRGGESPKGVGPVAISDGGSDVGASGIGSTEIAAVPGNVSESHSTESPAASTFADAGHSPTAEVAIASKVADSGATGMTAERALQLASEGRLVLRVRDAAAVNRLAMTRSTSAWRVNEPLPEVTVAMLAPAAVHTPSVPQIPFGVPVASFAGPDGEMGPVSINPALQSRQAAKSRGTLPEVPSAGRIIDLREDEGTLDALCEQLRKQLGANVEFEEVAEPVMLDEAAPTAESVLWWLQPTQTWGKRVRVPLIIDAR